MGSAVSVGPRVSGQEYDYKQQQDHGQWHIGHAEPPQSKCLSSLGSVLGTHRAAGVTMRSRQGVTLWARPRGAAGVLPTTDRPRDMRPNVHVEGQAPMTRRLEYRCKKCGRRYATSHPRGPRGSARCPVAVCQGPITTGSRPASSPASRRQQLGEPGGEVVTGHAVVWRRGGRRRD
jgi:hypothetical protein